MYKAIGNKLIVELTDRDEHGNRKTDGGLILTDKGSLETPHTVLQATVVSVPDVIKTSYGIEVGNVVLAKKHTLVKIEGNVYCLVVNDVEAVL